MSLRAAGIGAGLGVAAPADGWAADPTPRAGVAPGWTAVGVGPAIAHNGGAAAIAWLDDNTSKTTVQRMGILRTCAGHARSQICEWIEKLRRGPKVEGVA